MTEKQKEVAAWIAREVLLHEGAVRGWLQRHWREDGNVDVDDVIQEVYCRLSELRSVDHIENGRAYFFRAAHSVAIDMLRRRKSANLADMTENDLCDVVDDAPLADRVLESQQQLERVDGLLATLSETCRRVILMRRVEGLSQRETANRLGVSENVVENNIVRGLRKVLTAIATEDARVAEEEDSQVAAQPSR